MKKLFFQTFLLIAVICHPAFSQQTNQNTGLIVGRLLTAGPVPVPYPVFGNPSGSSSPDLAELLQYDYISVSELTPEEGTAFRWSSDLDLRWQTIDAVDSVVHLSGSGSETPELSYAAFYMNTGRWLKGTIEVKSCHLFEVYHNGERIATKTVPDTAQSNGTCKPGSSSEELPLSTGNHSFVIKTLRDPATNAPWQLKVSFKPADGFRSEDLRVTVSPLRYIEITNVLDDPKVDNVVISPDGELAAVGVSRSLPPTDESESWIELYRTSDGKPVQTFRGGMQIGNFAFSPDGASFSYVQRNAAKSTLWIVSLTDGTKYPLLDQLADFAGYQWSPTSAFIVYSITEREEADKTGLRRFRELTDRWPWRRNTSHLHLVYVPTGVRKRLTSGEASARLDAISPDGSRLLVSRIKYDASERPYSFTEFSILNLAAMTLDSLHAGPWTGSAQWSPDGGKILFTGGPSLFGSAGINVSEGRIPNEYDAQAFIYDVRTGDIDAITRDFDPSVSTAVWSRAEQAIYLTTVDRSYQRLYRYDLRTKRYETIELGVEIIGSIDFANKRPVAVYTGETATTPPKFYYIELNRKTRKLISDPTADIYRNIRTGKVEPWTFTSEQGTKIDGMVYYPPDFDPSKKYPVIVYYYGGTTPVNRQFEGRYPKNLWASHGYITYVPQPSGAIGYGQEFSSLHVNNWGITVADEIIEGTQKFLDAHPYADRSRVAGIGASYGGFMTMLLLTRTDIFATAVAHAGISSLASYWGQGYWGYLYSAIATANSFPWNRRDIFVDQSPIYLADRIHTPLLLLHGKSDTNVPPGESLQLYTALKLLGREVEYIEIEAQDHHILNYSKRIAWGNTIIAWFDKWLKDEPEWWDSMYK